MKIHLVILAGLIFLLGGMIGLLLSQVVVVAQSPLSVDIPTSAVSFEPRAQTIFEDPQKPSPANRITEDDIIVHEKEVIINKSNIQWSRYAATLSMDPVIDVEANGLELIPDSPNELQVGDIIAYRFAQTNSGVEDEVIIVHRIYATGYDEEGWYAITKGDNLKNPDPYKVRFDQILRVLVGILY